MVIAGIGEVLKGMDISDIEFNDNKLEYLNILSSSNDFYELDQGITAFFNRGDIFDKIDHFYTFNIDGEVLIS